MSKYYSIMKDNKYFTYFNPNPDAHFNKKTGEYYRWNKCDCSIRCFCGILNKSWSEVFTELCSIAASMFDMPDSPKVIDAYAKKIGMIKKSLPKYITVSQFVRKYPGKYICNIRSHVFCVKENKIYDTWDPSEYKMKTYYELNK